MKNIYTFGIVAFFAFLFCNPSFSQTTYQIGTGTSFNGTTDYPSPFGNYYYGSKEQYLFTASELSASGMNGSQILELGWQVANVNACPALPNFEIKVALVNDQSLLDFLNPTFTTVYSNSFYQPILGWNMFSFMSPFLYDGTSSILVEVCFNDVGYQENASVYYTSTASPMTANYHADQSAVCSSSSGTTYNNRPNIRFTAATPSTKDLGIISWVSPQVGATPNATMPIAVEVKNFGTQAQHSFQIAYSIDAGTTIISETYNDTLDPGDTLLYQFTQTANMSTPGMYDCGAAVTLTGDSISYNDTFYAATYICNPLNGTYTIGGTGSPDFATISEAVTALNSCGVSSSVTFNIAIGSYNEQISIGNISGASATNTITFQSATQNADQVTIQYSADPSANYIVQLNNASYVTIRDIRITATNSSAHRCVLITEGSNNNQILNNIINCASVGNQDEAILIQGGSNSNFNLIQNNEIWGGYYSIYVHGFDNYTLAKENRIIGNTINQFESGGIIVENQDSCQILNNTVNQNGPGYALYAGYINNGFNISGNEIEMNSTSNIYGLYLDNINATGAFHSGTVSNNMIYLTGGGNASAMYLQNTQNTLFAYNTSYSDQVGSASKCLSQSNGAQLQFINNIYSANAGAVADFNTITAIDSVIHNNFYNTGTATFIDFGASNYGDVNSFNTTNLQANDNIQIDPGYYNSSDLHVTSIGLNGSAKPLTNITADIDGDTRNTSTPDIGADEFTPASFDLKMLGLDGNYTSCNINATTTVSVKVENLGTSTLTSLPLKYSVDGGAYVSQTFTSTLATGLSSTFNFSTTANLSVVGDHYITLVADLSNDQIRENDTIILKFYKTGVIALPFYENFEDTTKSFFEAEAQNEAKIYWDANNHMNGTIALSMEGGNYQGWNYNGYDINSMKVNNYDHHVELTSCPLDASSYSNLRMSFTLRQEYTSAAYNNMFYVKINDTIFAKDINGDSLFTAIYNGDDRNMEFDLSQYAGSNMTISLEAYLRYSSYYWGGNGDRIDLDDIQIWEPASIDAGIMNIESAELDCAGPNDSLFLQVKNYGLNTITSVPYYTQLVYEHGTVTYQDTFNGNILPFATETFFIGTFNSKFNGNFSVVSATSVAGDNVHGNDTLAFSGISTSYFESPYRESFEGQNLSWNRNGFQIQRGSYFGLTGHWMFADIYSTSEYITPETNNDGLSGGNYTLQSEIPFTNINNNSYLAFNYVFGGSLGYGDSVSIFVSNDCGNSFTNVYNFNSSNTNFFPQNADGSRAFIMPMSSYSGQDLEIGVVCYSGYNNGYQFFIDSLGITSALQFSLGNDTAICDGASVVLSTNLSGGSYTYQWKDASNGAVIATTATYTASASGTYICEVSDGVSFPGTDTINVMIHPGFGAYFHTTDFSLCEGDSKLGQIQLNGVPPFSIDMYDGTNTVTHTASNFFIDTLLTPTVTTGYILTNMMDGNGCIYSGMIDTLTATVNPNPTISFSSLASDYCESDAAIALTATPTGGSYSGSGVTGNNFDPSLSGVGNYYITYSYTDQNGCSNDTSVQTIVHSIPQVAIINTFASSYCTNETPFTINTFPSGGNLIGVGITGNTLDPSVLTAGSHTISYNFTDANGCYNADTASVNISSVPAVTISTVLNASYCSNESPVTLSATPSGGTFTGNGISGNTFDPSLATPGNIEIIYSYSDGSCANSDTIQTIVYAQPSAFIATSLQSDYCEDANAISLVGYPSGGAFSGDGVSAGSFVPSMATTGSNQIIYTYTDVNSCTNSDTVSVTVNAISAVSISTVLNASYCSNETSVSLTATPSGGTFTGNGISGNTFDPALATAGNVEIIYTYTDGNSCANSDTIHTIVYAQPNALIVTQIQNDYCENGANVALMGYPNGGTFTGDGISTGSFIPQLANLGTNEIVYTYTDAFGCSNADTTNTVVHALPTVNIGSLADICENASNTVLSGATPSGGSYSGLGINSLTNTIYPSILSPGYHEVVYSYTDAFGCTNTDTNDIQIIGNPQASFALPSMACKSDSIGLQYTGNASGTATFSWDFDNANILAGTGVGPYGLSWDTAGIKVLTLSVTDSGCTSQMVTEVITINDGFAQITAAGSTQLCYGDSVVLFANTAPGLSYQWYNDGTMLTGITTSFLKADSTGNYYCEVTDAGSCKAISDTIPVMVGGQIVGNFTLPTLACVNNMVNITFNGIAEPTANFIWNFDGGMIASGNQSGPYNIIWDTDSIKTVSLQVAQGNCASEMITKTIDIVGTPANITTLGSSSFCAGGNVVLYANSGPYNYQWKLNGSDISSATQAFYTGTQSGLYTVETTDTNNLCSNVSDSVVVTVHSDDFNLAFTANQTSFTIPPFNPTITNQTPNPNDYYWGWTFGDGNTSTVKDPAHQYLYNGSYTVGLVAQNIQTGCLDTLIKPNYISCSGAGNNPCSVVANISAMGSTTICQGDTLVLYADSVHTNYTYQWLLNGVLLSGANDTLFYASQNGMYQVMVSDGACTEFSTPFSVSNYPSISPTILSNGSIMPCTNDSMELYVPTYFPSYLWSTGDTTSNIYVKTSNNYQVTATDINGCQTSSQPFIVNGSLLQTQEICLVGVDTNNHNRIIWERNNDPLIDSFRIYREGVISGQYDLIGTKGQNQQSILSDTNSNPSTRAYRYYITAVDTCGTETPPSPYHKSIHLTINAGLNGSWNLIWDGYTGFTFGSYRIYRGANPNNMNLLTQLPSTSLSYTDLNPPSGTVYYQIEVVKNTGCYPDSIYNKAQTNYNTSRSNVADNAMIAPLYLTADFNANVMTGIWPIQVEFKDLSLGSPTSWKWNFGDGNSSIEQNPNHTYNNTGVYTVTLEVCNQGACDTVIKTNFINVLPNGIVEVGAQLKTNLYPNPNDGKFTLEIETSVAGNYIIEVLNVLGQIIYSEKNVAILKQTTKDIDLSHLTKGIYYIRVHDNNQQQVKKIVIN